MKNLKHKNFKLTVEKLKFNLRSNKQLNSPYDPNKLSVDLDSLENEESIKSHLKKSTEQKHWNLLYSPRHLIVDNGPAFIENPLKQHNASLHLIHDT